MRRGGALFYASDIARGKLQLFVRGALEPPAIDTIAFTDEAGGDFDRELAVPFLGGMDEFVVTEAELAFRAADMPLKVTQYSVRPGPGGGVVLSFQKPVRLRKVILRHAAVVTPPAQLRLIVRPMANDKPGPPILAAPDFDEPGSTFARILTGLDMEALGHSRYALTFPDLLGTAWLLQVATGGSAVALQPLAEVPGVEKVEIAAPLRNLSLTLGGSPPTPLWSNPDALMPASGEQRVSFLPIAQRRLGEALADPAPAAETLPLILHFHSDSGGSVEVTDWALHGEYRVRPLGDTPVTLPLTGRPARLVLSAPAARRPRFGRTTLTARLLGRALNAGSPPAPMAVPSQGLRATPERSVAACLLVAPRNGGTAPVPLASLALRLDVPAGAELVLELRGDSAGRPGTMLAPPIVQQIAAGFAGWLELVLPAPLPVPPTSLLWAAIRMTSGTALWQAGTVPAAPAAPCVSADRGASWGDASSSLGLSPPLLVQVFHVEDVPRSAPDIRFHDGRAPFGANWLAGAAAEGGSEFRLVDAALPDAVLARIAATPAARDAVRADTEILLYSPSVLDLVLTGMLLGYEPRQ